MVLLDRTGWERSDSVVQNTIIWYRGVGVWFFRLDQQKLFSLFQLGNTVLVQIWESVSRLP